MVMEHTHGEMAASTKANFKIIIFTATANTSVSRVSAMRACGSTIKSMVKESYTGLTDVTTQEVFKMT